MAFLNSSEKAFLQAVQKFAYCNPFLPEHSEFEKAALGPDYVEGEPVWSQAVADPEKPREIVWRIFKKLEPLALQLRKRLLGGASPRTDDLVLYEDAILHLLYQRYYAKFYEASFGDSRKLVTHWNFYYDYAKDWKSFFDIGIKFVHCVWIRDV